jgi:hypothetical protein
MFCPVCRTEYRPGFSKCADCGVGLVDHLPQARPGADAEIVRDPEGRELLWSGLSAKLYEAIHDALDDAAIPHNDVEKEFGALPTFTESAHLIWIDPSVRDAAQSVLRKILADLDAAGELQEAPNRDHLAWMDPFNARRDVYASQSESPRFVPSELLQSDAPEEPVADDTIENFNPEDAAVEVWSGEDADRGDFLRESLNGIGIGCVLSEDSGKSRVLVVPADESRAKEIVREVVEGAPPE